MSDKEKSNLRIFNSLTRKKEEFSPIKPPFVGLYVCGPTVYGDPHLGHARSAITFDIVFRYLKFLGYKVRYVRNITDVGHLEDEEAEQGEDKIAKKARIEQLEPMEIVQTYTIRYHEGMDALNCLHPSIEPTASGHIIEQIELIKEILANGLAYEVDGNVYFDLETYRKSNDYGELSGKVLEDLQTGSRDTEGLDEKRNPHDFALWKKASESHIMRWPSPWGEGFPGWHLECTSMSTKYLGDTFDIHGGGLDLQFPHHEAEIAQSRGAHGCDPARYWLHNNMVTIDGAKMSKSAGNFVTLEQLFKGDHDLLEKEFDPMVVRFLMLQSHYRSKIDFSNEALSAAEKGYQRLMNAAGVLRSMETSAFKEQGEGSEDAAILKSCQSCFDTLNDDFNTAQTLASLFDLASKINALQHGQMKAENVSLQAFTTLSKTFEDVVFDIFGLREIDSGKNSKTEELVELLIEIRSRAREKKDFETSDKIRDDLQEIGIQLKDEKSGQTTFTIN